MPSVNQSGSHTVRMTGRWYQCRPGASARPRSAISASVRRSRTVRTPIAVRSVAGRRWMPSPRQHRSPPDRAAVVAEVATEVTQVEDDVAVEVAGRLVGASLAFGIHRKGHVARAPYREEMTSRQRGAERRLRDRWLLARDGPVDLAGHRRAQIGGADAPELEPVPVLGDVGEHGDHANRRPPERRARRVATLAPGTPRTRRRGPRSRPPGAACGSGGSAGRPPRS